MTELPALETPRLVLRAVEVTDAPRFHELLADPEVAAGLPGTPWPYEFSDALARIQLAVEGTAAGRSAPYIVIGRAEHDIIGFVALELTPVDHHAELGYWIGRPYWGQGFATEAGGRLLRYGFTARHLNRIFARCFADNPASLRVLEKLGMTREVHQRRALQHHGAFMDVLVYGILRSEFSKQ